MSILSKIKAEIAGDKFYQDHFSNDGFRLKKNDSVMAESLVASTMVGMMEGMSSVGGKNIKEILILNPEHFELRWKAE